MAAAREFDARGTAFLSDALAQIADTLRASTVVVRGTRDGGGSGVIWSSDGLIVTNAHVAPNKFASVELSDGRTLKASVVERVPDRDLAALRVDASGLPAATIGDSTSVRVGQLTFAMGNPLGITNALTSGIVHAKGAVHPRARHDWIQAAIRLMPGNSGGPLADARGAVIGINSMIVAGTLALAVPSVAVVGFLGGSDSKPRLGVSLEPVFVRNGRSGSYGLMVVDVFRGGAADRAGLTLGDVIIAADGVAIADPEALASVLARAGLGGSVLLQALRAGKILEWRVGLEPNRQSKNEAA